MLALCSFGQLSVRTATSPTRIAVAAARAEAPEKDEARAFQEFEAGRELYLRGFPSDALPHLRRAYVLSGKRPSTIRALAQCERAVGSLDVALELYREYLATGPAAPDAAVAERAIAEIEAHRAQRSPPAAPTDDGTLVWGADTLPEASRREAHGEDAAAGARPNASAEPSIVERPWFWIVTGAVVVLGGTAVAFAATRGNDAAPPYGGSLDRVLLR